MNAQTMRIKSKSLVQGRWLGGWQPSSFNKWRLRTSIVVEESPVTGSCQIQQDSLHSQA